MAVAFKAGTVAAWLVLQFVVIVHTTLAKAAEITGDAIMTGVS